MRALHINSYGCAGRMRLSRRGFATSALFSLFLSCAQSRTSFSNLFLYNDLPSAMLLRAAWRGCGQVLHVHAMCSKCRDTRRWEVTDGRGWGCEWVQKKVLKCQRSLMGARSRSRTVMWQSFPMEACFYPTSRSTAFGSLQKVKRKQQLLARFLVLSFRIICGHFQLYGFILPGGIRCPI